MELPTYTNIWKIEKRLYKLYDFRLPMPLPIGQVTAFLAIAVPYMLILTLAGMPFSHTWVWIYVLPPGVLAWLVTRPVLEGKRLPELVLSQVRYLTEPRAWCRMAPLAENDRVIVVAQVWRAPASLVLAGPAAAAAVGSLGAVASTAGALLDDVDAPAGVALLADAGLAADAWVVADAGLAADVGSQPAATDVTPQPSDPALAIRPSWPDRPAVGPRRPVRVATAEAVATRTDGPVSDVPVSDVPVSDVPVSDVAVSAAATAEVPVSDVAVSAAATADVAVSDVAVSAAARSLPDTTGRRARGNAAISVSTVGQPFGVRHVPGAVRPPVTVQADPSADRPLHVVERALRTSPASTGGGWCDRVVVVPGGHRPGKPDHVQRDQARARLALAGPARIVVLGTTAGAGQTVTTLLTGQLLASLRGEAVAVLDLSAGPASLTELAREIPRLLPGRQPAAGTDDQGQRGPVRERALQVVTAEHAGPGPRDADRLIDAVCARYPLTIADPPAADVPRTLQVADQLVLVSPAGADAAGSLSMTLEWLEAHGHDRLVRAAVTVLNGVSPQTTAYAERAAGVAVGHCRAAVRVPWDARLSDGGALGPETVRAYTALAGVLIAGLADSDSGDPVAPGRPPVDRAPAGWVSP